MIVVFKWADWYDSVGDTYGDLLYFHRSENCKRRKQIDMKQNVLADKLNISNNYLSGIERGKEKPSLEILVKICNELQVTPDYLLMGNMYSNIVPQNIVNGLQLCSEEDIVLMNAIMQHMVECRSDKWNSDNFA